MTRPLELARVERDDAAHPSVERDDEEAGSLARMGGHQIIQVLARLCSADELVHLLVAEEVEQRVAVVRVGRAEDQPFGRDRAGS